MFQVLSEDIISSIHANWGRDGPPGIPLYEVVSIFNFYVMNTRDSMLAMSKVFEIYPESDDVEFMDSLKCFIKFYSNTEDSFSDHCREAKKLLEYKSGPNDGKFSSAIFYVAFQLNLPIPLEESWIDSPLWDYHFYCANIFWPKVISTFKLHNKQKWEMIGNLREFMISIINDSNQIKSRFLEAWNKILIGKKIISRHDEEKIFEISEIDFYGSPLSKMKVSTQEHYLI